MPLNSIESVRFLIGDLPKAAIQEMVARGDGTTIDFQLDMAPVQTASLTVYSTGAAISASANFSLGTFQTTNSAPAAGNQIVATYRYFYLSDDEIQRCLDLASGAGTMLAASFAAHAVAANVARFFRYTQGEKSVDKDSMADKFLKLAERLEDAYEAGITMGGYTLTTMRFDDSGTHFDGYDTGSSNGPVETDYWNS